MTDPTTIHLPADLLPGDGRFGSGPSKVRPDALAALAALGPTYMGTSHRRDGVRAVVRRAREGLATLFGLPDGYEVLLGNGGSTAFWDALAFGMIESRSAHLVIGEFSAKFAAVTRGAPFLADPVVQSVRGLDVSGTTEQLAHVAELIPAEWLAHAATGSPADCVAAVRGQLALGCDAVILHGASPSELAPIVAEYRRTRPAGG